MKKLFILFAFSVVSIIKSQTMNTITVLDAEDSSPVSNAKIVTDNGVFYTNEDGKVLIPPQNKNIEVSAQSYEIKNIDGNSLIISLKPVYRNIEEVAITNIDIKKIFQSTIDNYQKIYYTDPSLYTGTIKQKSFIDNKLIHLLVADINIWLRYNFFNFGKSNDPDSFFQIGLNNIKYYKTKKMDDDFVFQSVPNLIPKDFIRTSFMNYHLTGILNSMKDLKIKTKLLYENSGIENIYFESEENTEAGVKFTGILTYNRNDNAIVNLKTNIDQKNTSSEKTDKNGNKYTSQTTKAEVFYDFYKKNNKYIPSFVTANGSGYLLQNGEKTPFSAYQEIKLEKFQEGNRRGLKNKINLAKTFIENVPDKSINETQTLLSKEEQEFINSK